MGVSSTETVPTGNTHLMTSIEKYQNRNRVDHWMEPFLDENMCKKAAEELTGCKARTRRGPLSASLDHISTELRAGRETSAILKVLQEGEEQRMSAGEPQGKLACIIGTIPFYHCLPASQEAI